LRLIKSSFYPYYLPKSSKLSFPFLLIFNQLFYLNVTEYALKGAKRLYLEYVRSTLFPEIVPITYQDHFIWYTLFWSPLCFIKPPQLFVGILFGCWISDIPHPHPMNLTNLYWIQSKVCYVYTLSMFWQLRGKSNCLFLVSESIFWLVTVPYR
jgi:hypothetical protein